MKFSYSHKMFQLCSNSTCETSTKTCREVLVFSRKVHNKAQFKWTFPYILQNVTQILLKFNMGDFHYILLDNFSSQPH
jgi:hypothetical protein